MAKKTIDVKKNEQCLVVGKCDTVMVFKETTSGGDKISAAVELILPDTGVLDGEREYASVAMATAIAMKIKCDPNFIPNMITWFSDYIQSHGQDTH